MTSTIGYTIHSDEQSMSFNVVAYFKPETAVITLLKDEPAVRIRVSAAAERCVCWLHLLFIAHRE
eukprot:scaffold112175_cov33-Tisochrysis_lutea.AAC.1